MSMKRILALLLTVTMLVSLGVPALAANEGKAPEKAEVVKGSISDKEFDPISLGGTKGDTKGADAITVKIYIYGDDGEDDYYYRLAETSYDTLEEAVLDVNAYMSSWAEQLAEDANSTYGAYGYTFYGDYFYCVYQLNEDISVDSINFPYGPGVGDEIDLNGHTLTINPGAVGNVDLYALYNGSIEILSDGDLPAAAAIAEQFSNIRDYGYERPTSVELTDDAAITGVVDLPDDVVLVVHDGETLDVSAAGAAINGRVVVEAGGTVIERMTWDGITSPSDAQNLLDDTFPATGYSVTGISDLTLEAGATEKAYLEFTVNNITAGTTRTLVGDATSGLIHLTSGSLNKVVDGDKTTITINGDVTVDKIDATGNKALSFAGGAVTLEVDGDNFYMPLFNTDVVIESGTTTLNQKVSMVSGDITVGEDATLVVDKLAVLDGTTLTVAGDMQVEGGLFFGVSGLDENDQPIYSGNITGANGAVIGFANPMPETENVTYARDFSGMIFVFELPVAANIEFGEATVISGATYTFENDDWTIDLITEIKLDDTAYTEEVEFEIGSKTVTAHYTSYMITLDSVHHGVAVLESDKSSWDYNAITAEDARPMIAYTAIADGVELDPAYGNEFQSKVAAYYMNTVASDMFDTVAVLTKLVNEHAFAGPEGSKFVVLLRMGITITQAEDGKLVFDIAPIASVYEADDIKNNGMNATPVNYPIDDCRKDTVEGFTVRIPVPSNWQTVTMIHGEDEIELQPVNGYVEFTVDHFSEFELIGDASGLRFHAEVSSTDANWDPETHPSSVQNRTLSAVVDVYRNHDINFTLTYGHYDLHNVSASAAQYKADGSIVRQFRGGINDTKGIWVEQLKNGSVVRSRSTMKGLDQIDSNISAVYDGLNSNKIDRDAPAVALDLLADLIQYELPADVDTTEDLDNLDGQVRIDSGAIKFRYVNNESGKDRTEQYDIYINTSKDQLTINAEASHQVGLRGIIKELKNDGYVIQSEWKDNDDFVIFAQGSEIQIADEKLVFVNQENIVLDTFRDEFDGYKSIAKQIAKYIIDRTEIQPATNEANRVTLAAGSTIGYDGTAYTLTSDVTVELFLTQDEQGVQRSFGQNLLSNARSNLNDTKDFVAEGLDAIRVFAKSVLDDDSANDITTFVLTVGEKFDDVTEDAPAVIDMCTSYAGDNSQYQTGEDKTEFLVLTKDGEDLGAKRMVVDFENSYGVDLSNVAHDALAAIAGEAAKGLTNKTHIITFQSKIVGPTEVEEDENSVTYELVAYVYVDGIEAFSAKDFGLTVTTPNDVQLAVPTSFVGENIVLTLTADEQEIQFERDGYVINLENTDATSFVLTKELVIPDTNFVHANRMILQGTLLYDFAVHLTDEVVADEGAYVIITTTGDDDVSFTSPKQLVSEAVGPINITNTVTGETETCYIFEMPIKAQDLDDYTCITLYNGNDQVIPFANATETNGGCNIPAFDYLDRIAGNGDAEAAFAQATKVYSKYADYQFNGIEPDAAYAIEVLDPSVLDARYDKGDESYDIARLQLKEGTDFEMMINAANSGLSVAQDYHDVDSSNFDPNACTSAASGSKSVVKIPLIAAQDLDDTFEVTIGGKTIVCGPFTYVKDQLTNSSSESLKLLLTALYYYHIAAEDLLGGIH